MCKVFLKDEWEKYSLEGGIVRVGTYHRYWLPDHSVNPEFRKDMMSGFILDVKECKETGLRFFYNQLNGVIADGISVCVVPSHKHSETNQSGIARLARMLARQNRIDKVDCLLRKKTIDKLANGGSRSEQVQRESLMLNPEMGISGDVILLVDDVTTSGISLKICRELLIEAGAERVAMLALGKSEG